jgi:protein-S-isoprenylcysteine O-methyltransferase Ste14
MAWSTVDLPAWLRWAGVIVGLAMLPVLYWVLRSIGDNISETILTKESHGLVTHGPYRWIRHPLYSVASIAFLALGLISANAFILVSGVVILAGIALFVVPKEDAQLEAKFGDPYREYRRKTGSLLPRLKAVVSGGW